MTVHPEVLPPLQVDALRVLAPLATEAGFYLGGGTAVALHLGHRRSLDFDWFCGRPLGDPLALAARLRATGADVGIRAIDRGTLHAELGGVATSFLEYTYPALDPGLAWPEFGCTIASTSDLACMKLSAAASRGSRKDFVDIFALGQSGMALTHMLDLYRRKYDARDVTHVLASLTYFDDAVREPMPEMLWPVAWDEITETLEEWVRSCQ